MVPDFQMFMKPVLEAVKDGERDTREVIDEITDALELSEEDRAERLKNGRTKIYDRVYWARSYLKAAGLVRLTKRRRYEITEEGKELLRENPEKIDRKYLKRYPSFVAFITPKSSSENLQNEPDAQNEPAISENTETPADIIKAAHDEINQALISDLRDALIAASPSFFEHVIVELLFYMDYGYDEDAGQVIGKSGDGGVDGVINLDPLGVDQVYIQAKRYQKENSVGSAAIRDFYGALSLKDVARGLFVTTSSFTKNAKETADKLPARIVLIDGTQLARLMIKHDVGCRTTTTYKIASLDEAYFDD